MTHLSTRTTHGSTQEQVYDEHDQEEDSKDDAQVEQPHRYWTTVLTRLN